MHAWTHFPLARTAGREAGEGGDDVRTGVWRYPVKSMRGERLERARVEADGIAGDRLVHVARGATGGHLKDTPPAAGAAEAGLDASGPLVDGQPWDSPAAAAAVQAAAGPRRAWSSSRACSASTSCPSWWPRTGGSPALGEDGRRLRPNLVVGGVEGLAERDWPGRRLRIGEGGDRRRFAAPALRHDHLPPGHAGAGPGCPAPHRAPAGGPTGPGLLGRAAREVAVGDPVVLD